MILPAKIIQDQGKCYSLHYRYSFVKEANKKTGTRRCRKNGLTVIGILSTSRLLMPSDCGTNCYSHDSALCL